MITGILRWYAYEYVQKDEFEKLSFQAKLAEKEVSGFIRSVSIVLEEIEQALVVDDVESAVKLGEHYKKLFPEIRSFTIVDHAGIIRAASIKALIGGDRSQAAYYKEARANPDGNKMLLGRPFKDPLGASIMLYNYAVADSHGQLKWIAIVSVDLKFYDQLLAQLINTETQTIFLVHGDGLILSHNADYEGLRLQPLSQKAEIAERHLSSVERHHRYEGFNTNDAKHIYGVTADVVPETFLLSNRLVVGITEEAGSVFSDWSTDTIVYSLSWLLVSILIIYLVYLYTIREKYLLESESRFRDFTDTASDWIWEMDAELRFSYLSEQFFNLANFQPQDLIGKRRWEYTSAESAGVTEEAWQAHRRLMEEHQPFRDFRYNVKDAAGIEHSISLSGNPVFLHDQFMGYRGTGANITALVAALNKAQEAQKKAEAASEAKSEFLSSMSHELRTPMNAILGYAQILQMTVDDPEHKDSIRIMLESGRHLMELINDVLDLSVIEAEQIQYHLEPVNVTLLLQECNALCQPLAIERGATVELEAGELSESCCVSADVVRLKQALLNYLSNAIKYGKQHDGVIRVVASQQKQNVRIAVIDNGVGISAEKISQLFLPFNRLGLEGGTVLGAGLGLSITKKIIELMGGVVGVQSEAGKGAEFWLELPACEISIEAEVAEK